LFLPSQTGSEEGIDLILKIIKKPDLHSAIKMPVNQTLLTAIFYCDNFSQVLSASGERDALRGYVTNYSSMTSSHHGKWLVFFL
jgi:hypothetical protein